MTEDEYICAVRRSARRIYLIAFSYTRNRYDAEDIMQNTFLKLWKTDVSYESDEHLDRWLTRVCVNECKDFLSFPSEKTRRLRTRRKLPSRIRTSTWICSAPFHRWEKKNVLPCICSIMKICRSLRSRKS